MKAGRSIRECRVELWVIYRNPSDFPQQFVTRRWCGSTPDPNPMYVGNDVAAARQIIPAGTYRLGRYAGDDPAILEVWV